MKKSIKLSSNLEKIRETDSRLISYNIEMTEVTGGTFWKCYTLSKFQEKKNYLK